MIYQHKKNKKYYLKLMNISHKFDGVWYDSVAYICLYFNKQMIYSRTKCDFERSFIKKIGFDLHIVIGLVLAAIIIFG